MRPYVRQRNGRTTVDDVGGETRHGHTNGGIPVADIQISDGIIRIADLDIQDPKAAAVLAAYPQVRWAEITRRAVKIGLGYLKGGEKD
jgi:hypothetical protein